MAVAVVRRQPFVPRRCSYRPADIPSLVLASSAKVWAILLIDRIFQQSIVMLNSSYDLNVIVLNRHHMLPEIHLTDSTEYEPTWATTVVESNGDSKTLFMIY